MSGQIKVFIDRLLPKWQNLGGEDAYVIVTGHHGKQVLQRAAEDIAAISTQGLSKANHLGRTCLAKGEVLGTKAMEEAYLAGKRIL